MSAKKPAAKGTPAAAGAAASGRKVGSRPSGNKFRIALALPVGAVMNCADNTGAKNLFCIAVAGILCKKLTLTMLTI